MKKKDKQFEAENWFINFMMITILVSTFFYMIHPIAGMIVLAGNLFNIKNWYKLSR